MLIIVINGVKMKWLFVARALALKITFSNYKKKNTGYLQK
ncbi:unnamed protein product, partial [marine sediment metagenome]